MLSTPPTSHLFPYTTLFRSRTLHICGYEWSPVVERDAGTQMKHVALAALLYFPAVGEPGKQPAVGIELGQPVEQRSEEHTSELQSRPHLVCRLLLEKKNISM